MEYYTIFDVNIMDCARVAHSCIQLHPVHVNLNRCIVFMAVSCWQDGERREDELNELRHLLEKNYNEVTKWKNDAVEEDKVCVMFELFHQRG